MTMVVEMYVTWTENKVKVEVMTFCNYNFGNDCSISAVKTVVAEELHAPGEAAAK